MKKTKSNYRKCLITKQVKHRLELDRYTVINKQVVFDKEQTLKGRGYYFDKTVTPQIRANYFKKKLNLTM